VAARVPRELAKALGRRVGEACWAAQARRRRVLSANWRLAARACGHRAPSARRAFRRFGEEIVETLRLLHAGPGEVLARVEFVNLERLEAEAASGLVLVSVHSGNWEWAGAALALSGRRVAALSRPHRGPVERFFRALRQRFGIATRRRARHAGRDGEWLAVFVDRAPRRGSASPRRAARRAVALAARSAVPVAACWVETRPGGRYRVTLGPALRAGRRRATRQAAARAVLAFLQSRLEREPEQWFAFEPLSELPLGGAA
jgi:KDO2-lipid IV(A) lauroyltransferase